ncbi:MAG: hypothetical protein ACI82G_002675 [Bradymonadia bacterium]|jgi:hypothetical protein
MAQRKKNRSESDWSRICARHERSGMTARAFAEAHDLNYKTLLWWRSRLRSLAETPVESSAQRFVEVVDEPLAVSDVGVTIRCGNNVIECASLPPAAWVREVVGAC